MRMDIKLVDGTKVFLHYEQFEVASAKHKYKLTIGGFHGTTKDPLSYRDHNGMVFSTKDNDNDPRSNNCALLTGPSTPNGGWWFNKYCWGVNPNNFYKQRWGVLLNGSNNWYTLPFVEMKIRPVQCNI